MPPVAIDGDSGLCKFKKKREQKHGLNMYLTISQCHDVVACGGEVVVDGGVDETWMTLNSPENFEDRRVVEAVEDEIRGYGGGTSRPVNNSIVEEELVDLFVVPLTYENEEFLEEVDEIFRSASKRNVVDIVERVTEDRNTVVGDNNGKRKRDWLARNGVSGSDITGSCF
ncbi:unnamed protein product [Arabis nemorensis]|uniref:Uncharacterized protein n=1 Tax=Arabis nemorensis TaxID=586526 RepID=A0A565BGN3_9BRAS|nr:unnamed protein product [Arabis nemorensis]